MVQRRLLDEGCGGTLQIGSIWDANNNVLLLVLPTGISIRNAPLDLTGRTPKHSSSTVHLRIVITRCST